MVVGGCMWLYVDVCDNMWLFMWLCVVVCVVLYMVVCDCLCYSVQLFV